MNWDWYIALIYHTYIALETDILRWYHTYIALETYIAWRRIDVGDWYITHLLCWRPHGIMYAEDCVTIEDRVGHWYLLCVYLAWRPAWRPAWRVETLIFMYGDLSPLKAFVNCALLLMEREAVKTQCIEVICYVAWWKCKNPSFSREVHKPYFWPNSLHGVTATSGAECLKRRDLLLKCICCVLELPISDCLEDQLWIWRVKLLQKCWCFCNYYAFFTILLQTSTWRLKLWSHSTWNKIAETAHHVDCIKFWRAEIIVDCWL